MIMKYLGVDGWIILKWILKIECEAVDWIRVTENRDDRRACAKTRINFGLHKMR